jgi:hypothetical protein
MPPVKSLVSERLNRLKLLVGKSRIARDAVLQYRLRTGQPDWEHLTSSDAYRELLAAAQRGDGPRVLIATSDGAHLGGTRVESLLALALTARGARVDMLLCDGALPACQEATLHWYRDATRFSKHGPSTLHCNGCFKPAYDMYRSLGVPVHRYSGQVTDRERAWAADLAQGVPWEQIRTYRHDDVAIGEHAFAGAIRFYASAYLVRDPVTEPIVRRYFEGALLAATVARRLMKEHRYDVAVFHHGIYVPQGLIGDVARQEGVRVVNWHVAYRKKTFIFSHGDTYHHTLMSEPTTMWDGMAWTDRQDEQVMAYLKSRWKGTGDWIHFNRAPQDELDAIAREVGVDFTKPCIGMLTNVMWDAQLHYPANAFKDMLEWTLKTIAYFERRPELQLLIRVHPAEVAGALPSLQPIVEEIRKVYPTLPANVFVIPPESKASTYAAMLRCNAVIIYGTKTGVELTAMGIPIIVAGEAWIRNKGLTTDIASEQAYYDTLDTLPLATRLDDAIIRRARQYAFHFFFRRMIPIELTRVSPGTPGFDFDVPDVEAIAPGRDRGLDVICDGVLRETPFVYPAEAAEGK